MYFVLEEHLLPKFLEAKTLHYCIANLKYFSLLLHAVNLEVLVIPVLKHLLSVKIINLPLIIHLPWQILY